MGDKSKIEWTDATWNPVTGCTKVSQGCKNCYAETWANRKMGNFSGDRKFTDIICHEDRLEIPLKWKKPRKVFVNSMSDLFHEKVPFEFIDAVFQTICMCPEHTFQILTKRPGRMLEYFKWFGQQVKKAGLDSIPSQSDNMLHYVGPLPNVWLGVSVEDQKTADERIPILLETPAAVRWISAEPLLGRIELENRTRNKNTLIDGFLYSNYVMGGARHRYNSIDWVVVGGESGHNARPMHPDWVRKIRDDCKVANVPFFFKQWGEFITSYQAGERSDEVANYNKTFGDRWVKNSYIFEDETTMVKVGKHSSGNELDGKQHLEFPKSIQCVGVCTEEKTSLR